MAARSKPLALAGGDHFRLGNFHSTVAVGTLHGGYDWYSDGYCPAHPFGCYDCHVDCGRVLFLTPQSCALNSDELAATLHCGFCTADSLAIADYRLGHTL